MAMETLNIAQMFTCEVKTAFFLSERDSPEVNLPVALAILASITERRSALSWDDFVVADILLSRLCELNRNEWFGAVTEMDFEKLAQTSQQFSTDSRAVEPLA